MDNLKASNLSDEHIQRGLVIRKTSAGYGVESKGRIIVCGLSSQLLYQTERSQELSNNSRRKRLTNVGPRPADLAVVGDQVDFVELEEGRGTIVSLLPRHSQFSRRSAVPMPSAQPFEQVIAANIDQIVAVFAAANPEPKWNLLDRYLVSAESSELPTLICITKLDLAHKANGSSDLALEQALETYRQIGYPVVLTSAKSGIGLEELRQGLQGHLSVLLGKSGVGKTSLLNALQPGLGLRVNEVSRIAGKGKHTTSHLEMFPLEGGGALIDTPGVREFGLWDVDDRELAWFFPEMQPFIGQCKFGLDCYHDEEPGCAVRKAVSSGSISPYRYKSYLRLCWEL